MFGFLKKRAELKRRAHIRAEALLARHGAEAWQIVYGICRDQERDVEDRVFTIASATSSSVGSGCRLASTPRPAT
jgi:hypothetical protein